MNKPKPLTEKNNNYFRDEMGDIVYNSLGGQICYLSEDVLSAIELLKEGLIECRGIVSKNADYRNRKDVLDLIDECFQIRREK